MQRLFCPSSHRSCLSAANLGYDIVEVACFAKQLYIAFDFIGNVGNNLDCFAEIVATAFFVNDTLVNAAGCDIVGACGLYVCKTLVVSEVKVSLMSVYGHIAFAVFVGVEGSGVDVDIRVKLLNGHAVSAGFQQTSKRGRNDAFAKGGHNASGHENVFGFHEFGVFRN